MDAYLTKRKSPTPPDATAAPPPRKKLQRTAPGVAQPSRNVFDPWNSSSTGHQRAENRLAGSTSWRDSRNMKLNAQYHGGLAGGERVADTVGAGSKNFGKDGRKVDGGWVKGASGLRSKDQKSLWEVVEKQGASRFGTKEGGTQESLPSAREDNPLFDPTVLPLSLQPTETRLQKKSNEEPEIKKQIFRNLCIYINGSTAPLISDHKLKYLLTEHGAHMSFALGRRSVTHVIVGRTHDDGGTGGGLAGSKIQKEVSRIRGKGIKFVSVDWYVKLSSTAW
jgi:hypothetical protein